MDEAGHARRKRGRKEELQEGRLVDNDEKQQSNLHFLQLGKVPRIGMNTVSIGVAPSAFIHLWNEGTVQRYKGE